MTVPTFEDAVRAFEAGDAAAAAALCRALLAESPGHGGALQLLGVASFRAGDAAGAQATAELSRRAASRASAPKYLTVSKFSRLSMARWLASVS